MKLIFFLFAAACYSSGAVARSSFQQDVVSMPRSHDRSLIYLGAQRFGNLAAFRNAAVCDLGRVEDFSPGIDAGLGYQITPATPSLAGVVDSFGGLRKCYQDNVRHPHEMVIEFNTDTTAFAATFNLGVPLGRLVLEIVIEGTVVGDIEIPVGTVTAPNNIFFGVTTVVPFHKVTIRSKTGSSETFCMDDMIFCNQCDLEKEGEMEYVPSVSVDYTATTTQPKDYRLQWKSPSLGPSLGTEDFEVVLYGADAAGDCLYNSVLGHTSGADLTSPGTVTDHQLIGHGTSLPIMVDTASLPPNVVVDFDFPTTLFSHAAVTYVEALSGTPGSGNGQLYFCAELQHFACGSKREFLAVSLDIDYDLDSKCDTCTIAEVVREEVEDAGEVEPPKIDCVLGNDPGGGVYTQGDGIEVCIEYENTNVLDACMHQVLAFKGRFDCPNADGEKPWFYLLHLPNNEVLEISNSCSPPPLSTSGNPVTKCCVEFSMDQQMIQRLPPNEECKLEVEAYLRSNLGCSRRRNLKGLPGGTGIDRTLQEDAISIVEADLPITFEEFVEQCQNAGLFNINQLIEMFLNIISFGLLGGSTNWC